MKTQIAIILLLAVLLSGCEISIKTGQHTDTTLPSPATNPVTTHPSDAPTGFTPGFVMPDIRITTAKGETTTLHELVQENKLVVLNFWFSDCPFCIKEFPVIEVSYQRHKADMEILALSPVDSLEDIAAFQDSRSLSFPMASCTRELVTLMGIRAYPTSVFIDREGKISLIHAGAITDTRVWDRVFDFYLREDYRHQVFAHIEDIP